MRVCMRVVCMWLVCVRVAYFGQSLIAYNSENCASFFPSGSQRCTKTHLLSFEKTHILKTKIYCSTAAVVALAAGHI